MTYEEFKEKYEVALEPKTRRIQLDGFSIVVTYEFYSDSDDLCVERINSSTIEFSDKPEHASLVKFLKALPDHAWHYFADAVKTYPEVKKIQKDFLNFLASVPDGYRARYQREQDTKIKLDDRLREVSAAKNRLERALKEVDDLLRSNDNES